MGRMSIDRSVVRKWAQRAVIAVVVVWLIWLTITVIAIDARTRPLSQRELLQEIVALQGQINTVQEEINEINGVPSGLIPFDRSELEN
jgi:hypothetical protein